jgi:hypothetical protein
MQGLSFVMAKITRQKTMKPFSQIIQNGLIIGLSGQRECISGLSSSITPPCITCFHKLFKNTCRIQPSNAYAGDEDPANASACVHMFCEYVHDCVHPLFRDYANDDDAHRYDCVYAHEPALHEHGHAHALLTQHNMYR